MVAQSNRRKQNRFAVNDLNVGCRSVLVVLNDTRGQLDDEVYHHRNTNKDPEDPNQRNKFTINIKEAVFLEILGSLSHCGYANATSLYLMFRVIAEPYCANMITTLVAVHCVKKFTMP